MAARETGKKRVRKKKWDKREKEEREMRMIDLQFEYTCILLWDYLCMNFSEYINAHAPVYIYTQAYTHI